MKLPRRKFLHLATGAAALPVVSRVARAQSYPSRTVRIVVTFTAGGANDVHARLFGQLLSERLGQSFVVENRPGGGGNIGTLEVVRSAPDGHTLLLVSVGLSINAAIYEKLPYDLVRDIAPIAAFFHSNYVMVVTPSLPAKTVPEFITHAKANPGKLNFGSNGVGATGHLAGEMFKMMAGVNLQHVPYRGEPQALSDLMGGQVQVMFATMTGALPLIRAGQLRALAVTSKTRSTVLLDVPPVADFVPGYELRSWAGMAAPRDTPAAVIDLLNREINAGLMRPDIKAKYDDLGLNTLVISPAEFRTWIADDIQKWARVVKFAGIKPE
jgi:tripartite-type tricarboxylate transporter receptor subunit TctC